MEAEKHLADSSSGTGAPLLEVRDLRVSYKLPAGVVRAVRGVSLDIRAGETLGIVGESGSGKSATVMTILRLLPANGYVEQGSIVVDGINVLELSDESMRRLRGKRIALVPQNPMDSLNPVLRIRTQLREAIAAHESVPRDIDARLVDALRSCGLPSPETQLDRYPHELSGGMRQRVLIAMAIINRPALLLADEPTTALDTTTQAQILELLRELVDTFQMGMLLISHDLGVVARIADQVGVMYGGEFVEIGRTTTIFRDPEHAHTRALLGAARPMMGTR